MHKFATLVLLAAAYSCNGPRTEKPMREESSVHGSRPLRETWSTNALREFPKFLSFLGTSEPREIEKIEGTWLITNLDAIHLRDEIDGLNMSDPSPDSSVVKKRWEARLRELKDTTNSVHVRCLRSEGICIEALATVEHDESWRPGLPPLVRADLNIWDIKTYDADRLLATYYDGCYNFSVAVDIPRERVVKTGTAIEHSACHRGFTNSTVVYELGGGKSAIEF